EASNVDEGTSLVTDVIRCARVNMPGLEVDTISGAFEDHTASQSCCISNIASRFRVRVNLYESSGGKISISCFYLLSPFLCQAIGLLIAPSTTVEAVYVS